MVKTCSAENNRFKRSWEFGRLRRRIDTFLCRVDGSFQQRTAVWFIGRCLVSHVDATWNGGQIIRIDILPKPRMVAARPPASYVEEREHRFGLVSLCTGDPTDDCRTRPVSK